MKQVLRNMLGVVYQTTRTAVVILDGKRCLTLPPFPVLCTYNAWFVAC